MHEQRKTAGRIARKAAGVTGACLALAVVVLTAKGSPADAAVRHHSQRVLGHTLAYNPDGVQMRCRRSQAGELAIVSGDGRPFVVRCRADGPHMWVWDARS
jgi:hypothetical protein